MEKESKFKPYDRVRVVQNYAFPDIDLWAIGIVQSVEKVDFGSAVDFRYTIRFGENLISIYEDEIEESLRYVGKVNINEEIAYHKQKIQELETLRDAQKLTFTINERVILQNLPQEFKWIARDPDGTLVVFNVEPVKDQYGYWGRITETNMVPYTELFKSIDNKDEKAYNFRNFI